MARFYRAENPIIPGSTLYNILTADPLVIPSDGVAVNFTGALPPYCRPGFLYDSADTQCKPLTEALWLRKTYLPRLRDWFVAASAAVRGQLWEMQAEASVAGSGEAAALEIAKEAIRAVNSWLTGGKRTGDAIATGEAFAALPLADRVAALDSIIGVKPADVVKWYLTIKGADGPRAQYAQAKAREDDIPYWDTLTAAGVVQPYDGSFNPMPAPYPPDYHPEAEVE